MHAIAHGIDIVEVSRIAELRGEHGRRFMDRCFTADEQRYCLERRRGDEHLAGRFAAKEAVLKALGLGLRGGILWTDIEVRPDEEGAPRVALHGRAAELARERGIGSWLLSISHTSTQATASAIGLSAG
ncbi:MAG: holo-[acyl-carrier-protein] synthase [Leptolyngbya sp. PLA3]|nr:MAG: holo-[acyl-carrier-protein] synthase [Cyanobacteria bacterium CYA]MCE7968200.1 holo-[acyl-carrier-protein] synthase [Leptolyngbya sp. PL-A3]